jgi:hypothetical protein
MTPPDDATVPGSSAQAPSQRAHGEGHVASAWRRAARLVDGEELLNVTKISKKWTEMDDNWILDLGTFGASKMALEQPHLHLLFAL